MTNWEHATGEVVKVGQSDIDRMIELARQDPQHKYRLCLNPTADDLISEMVIIHLKDTVVPIHRHKGKSESFHWIRGQADVQLYTDDGQLFETITMGLFRGQTQIYRLNGDIYHGLKITSAVIAFHESTNGPWHKEDLILAPWWIPPKGWSR